VETEGATARERILIYRTPSPAESSTSACNTLLFSNPHPGPKRYRTRRPRNLMIFKVVIVQDWG